MSSSSPFGYQRDGFTLVCGDGPELLVYEGDGKPRWQKFMDELVVDVGVSREHILVLYPDGRLRWLRTADGEPFDEVDAGNGASALFVSHEGLAAVCSETALVVARPGSASPLPVAAPSCVAFGPGDQSLGVGTQAGSFHVFDLTSGEATGVAELGVPVGGAAWSNLGFWVVGAGTRLVLIAADGTSILQEIPGHEAPLVRCTTTAEGAVVAALLEGTSSIAVFEMQHKRRIGTITFRRAVHGIAFGPKCSLGVGLDDGDASTIDLFTGRSARTEPHPGRGRNNWNLKSDIEFPAVRGAVSFAMAGGSPVASFVYDETKQRDWVMIGFGCFLFFLLSGCLCTGLGSAVYFFY